MLPCGLISMTRLKAIWLSFCRRMVCRWRWVHATVEQPTAPSTVQPTATLISCPPPAGQQQQQGERVEEVRSSSSENQVTEQQETETFDMKTSACMGQPIVCRYEHCKREFTDGFGLCFPGRWLPGARNKLADADRKSVV